MAAAAPALMSPREVATIATDGASIALFGGETAEAAEVDLFADGAVLDLTTMTWEPLPDAPLAARGIGHDGWPYRENVRVDADRTWTPIAPAPSDARFATARRGGVLAVDDDVSEADPYVILWRYEEALERWDRRSTRLRTSLEIHHLGPERIVVSAHGDDGRWQDSPGIGVWEADSHRLVHTRPPLSPRWRTAIAPFPDGLLVWGGLNAEPVGDEGIDSRPVDDGARWVR